MAHPEVVSHPLSMNNLMLEHEVVTVVGMEVIFGPLALTPS